MSQYTVKGVKTFRGHEGDGYNATLYRDGKRVAELIEDATGGPLNIDWLDRGSARREIDWVDHDGKPTKITGLTVEEAMLYDHVRGKTWEFGGKQLQTDPDSWLGELVWDTVENQRRARALKTKTLFRLKTDKEGDYWTIKSPFTPEMKAYLQKKYGDQLLEIINERSAA